MIEEYVTFKSGDLTLEGIVDIPEGKGPFTVVVLCHPHPLYGGNMHDNVIVAVSRALTDKNIATLRFNFRGVGGSQGSYGGGLKERDDAIAAIAYISARNGVAADAIGLAGYSFGGGVAFNVALKDDAVRALALVSPVIPDSGWKKLGGYARPKLLVLGDSDEYFPLAKYEPKIKSALKPGEYEIFPRTDHFWMNNGQEMAERVAGFFRMSLSGCCPVKMSL